MQSTILTSTQEETFISFRAKFNDVTFFDRLLTEPVRKSIVEVDTRVVTLNATTAKSFSNKYICARKLSSKEDKALSVQINHILCTLFVFMIIPTVADTAEMKEEKIETLKNIINWNDCDDSERNLLITFRDIVRVAVTLFPSKDNKARILFIGHRLGGSNLSVMSYATGGGQSPQTDRRVRIYEYESGILATTRSSEAAAAETYIPAITVPASKKRAREVMEISPPPPDSSAELLKQYNDIVQMVEKYQATCAWHARQRIAHYQAPRGPSPSSYMLPGPAQQARDLMLPPSGLSRLASALGSSFTFGTFAQHSDVNVSALTFNGDEEVPVTAQLEGNTESDGEEAEEVQRGREGEEDFDSASLGTMSFGGASAFNDLITQASLTLSN